MVTHKEAYEAYKLLNKYCRRTKTVCQGNCVFMIYSDFQHGWHCVLHDGRDNNFSEDLALMRKNLKKLEAEDKCKN